MNPAEQRRVTFPGVCGLQNVRRWREIKGLEEGGEWAGERNGFIIKWLEAADASLRTGASVCGISWICIT